MNRLMPPLLLLLLLVGCSSNKEPRSVYVLLFDVSASIKQEQRKQYGQYIQDTWKHLSKEDDVPKPARMVGSLITGQSLGNEKILFQVTATSHQLTEKESKDAYQAHMNKAQKDLKNAEKTLLTSTAPGTEIVASLDFAKRVFDQYPNTQKSLVIFSDMIEQSSDGDFWDYTRIASEKGINRVIEQRKADGSLPNLKGVTVYICGATSSTSNAYRAIRKFWLKFFEATGADLKAQNYGSTLNWGH